MAEERNPKVLGRIQIGKRRIQNILTRYTIACNRTLEQKMADAGPNNQRVNPLYLTQARQELEDEGIVESIQRNGLDWFYLAGTERPLIEQRLAELTPIHSAIEKNPRRIGQALEIAVYKSLCRQDSYRFLGGFLDLDSHDDHTDYHKLEPPSSINGKSIAGVLDFIVDLPGVGYGGIEIKNTRPWIYPNNPLVKALLKKCCGLDIVPILVARRIAYVTFSEIFEPCGVIAHETYNQIFPNSDRDVAEKAKNKDLLGCHDIILRNDTGKILERFIERLDRFFHTNLPQILPKAYERFQEYKDILNLYALDRISYLTLHTEIRTRLGIYSTDQEEEFF